MKTYLIESGTDAFRINGEYVPYLVVYAENEQHAKKRWHAIVDDVETNCINFIKEVDYYPNSCGA